MYYNIYCTYIIVIYLLNIYFIYKSIIKNIYLFYKNRPFFQSDGVVRISPSRGARVNVKQVNVYATPSLWETFENMLFTAQINGKENISFQRQACKDIQKQRIAHSEWILQVQERNQRWQRKKGWGWLCNYIRRVLAQRVCQFLFSLSTRNKWLCQAYMWVGGFNECIILMSCVLVKRTPWILIIIVMCVCLHKHWKLDHWIQCIW